MKRLCANDSADSRVKVGHRQAPNPQNAQSEDWAFRIEVPKNFYAKRESVKTCVIIQGFADRGEGLQVK